MTADFFPTIASVNRSVEDYWRLVELLTGSCPTPPFQIAALDALLTTQLVELYPTSPLVFDLAGDLTYGASTVFWFSAMPSLKRLVCLNTDQEAAWLTWLSAYLDEIQANGSSDKFEVFSGDWTTRLSAQFPNFVVAVARSVEEMTTCLEQFAPFLKTSSHDVLLMTPFDLVGRDVKVEIALQSCLSHSQLTFRLGREISPMFGASQLGIFYPKNNTHLPHIFDRLRALYEGNFNFAALLSDNTSLRLRLKRLEAQVSHYEQLVNQQAQQIASHQAAQQGLEAQLAALVNAPPQPQLISPPSLLPLDGRQVPPRQTLMDRLRLRLSSAALGLRARALARLFYPRRLRPYKAQILGCSVPQTMAAGAACEGMLIVLNVGEGTWYPPYRTPHCVNISYHWLDRRGRVVVKEGLRTALPRDIAPGERVTVPFQVVAPASSGSYRLQPDLVHEGVRWLGELHNFPNYPVEVVTR